MVCVPCFIIPLLLYIWHKFVQPIMLRYWNPWEKKDAQGNVIKTEFPFECKGGVCPFVPGKKKQLKEDAAGGDEQTTTTTTGEEQNKLEEDGKTTTTTPVTTASDESKKEI